MYTLSSWTTLSNLCERVTSCRLQMKKAPQKTGREGNRLVATVWGTCCWETRVSDDCLRGRHRADEPSWQRDLQISTLDFLVVYFFFVWRCFDLQFVLCTMKDQLGLAIGYGLVWPTRVFTDLVPWQQDHIWLIAVMVVYTGPADAA